MAFDFTQPNNDLEELPLEAPQQLSSVQPDDLEDLPLDFPSSVKRLQTDFQTKFGRPFRITTPPGAPGRKGVHKKLYNGQAADIGGNDLSDDEASWLTTQAPQFGIDAKDYRKNWKDIGGSGPHLHMNLTQPQTEVVPAARAVVPIPSQPDTDQVKSQSIYEPQPSDSDLEDLPLEESQPSVGLKNAVSGKAPLKMYGRKELQKQGMSLNKQFADLSLQKPDVEGLNNQGKALEQALSTLSGKRQLIEKMQTDAQSGTLINPGEYDRLINEYTQEATDLQSRIDTHKSNSAALQQSIDAYNKRLKLLQDQAAEHARSVNAYNQSIKKQQKRQQIQTQPSRADILQSSVDRLDKEIHDLSIEYKKGLDAGIPADHPTFATEQDTINQKSRERYLLQQEIAQLKAGNAPKVTDVRKQLSDIESRRATALHEAVNTQNEEDRQRLYDTANAENERAQALKQYVNIEEGGGVAHPALREYGNRPLPPAPEKLPWYLRGTVANAAQAIISVPVEIERMALGAERMLGINPTKGFPEHIAEAEKGLAEIASRGGSGLYHDLERAVFNFAVRLPMYSGAARVGSVLGVPGETAAFGLMGGMSAAGTPETAPLSEIGKSFLTNAVMVPIYKGAGLIPNRAVRMAAAGVGSAILPAVEQRDLSDILSSALIGAALTIGGANRRLFSLDPEKPPSYVKPVLEEMSDYLTKKYGMTEEQAGQYVKQAWAEHVKLAEKDGLSPLEIRKRLRQFMKDRENTVRQYQQSTFRTALPPASSEATTSEPIGPFTAPPAGPAEQVPTPVPSNQMDFVGAGSSVAPDFIERTRSRMARGAPMETGLEDLNTIPRGHSATYRGVEGDIPIQILGVKGTDEYGRVYAQVAGSDTGIPIDQIDWHGEMPEEFKAAIPEPPRLVYRSDNGAPLEVLSQEGEAYRVRNANGRTYLIHQNATFIPEGVSSEGKGSTVLHGQTGEPLTILGSNRSGYIVKNEQNKIYTIHRNATNPLPVSFERTAIPETPVTLNAQMQALADGRKSAVLITPGEQMPEIPHGTIATHTPVGTFIHPASISQESVLDAALMDNYHGLLGLVSPRPLEGEPAVTVVAQTKDGQELQTAVVPPEDARLQRFEFGRIYPHAVISIGGENLNKAVLSHRADEIERQGQIVSETPARVTGVEGVVARQKQEQRKLRRELDTDVLTGVQSARAFHEAKEHIDRDPNREWVTIDLNNFKSVNDTLGHAAGDERLKSVGQAMLALKESNPSIQAFRSGGDEFSFAVPKGQGESIARQIEDAIKPEILANNKMYSVSATTDKTYDQADAKLQASKAERKSSLEKQAPPSLRDIVVSPGSVVHGSTTDALSGIMKSGIQPSELSGAVDVEVVGPTGKALSAAAHAIGRAGRSGDSVLLILKKNTAKSTSIGPTTAQSEGKSYISPRDIEAVQFADGTKLSLSDAVERVEAQKALNTFTPKEEILSKEKTPQEIGLQIRTDLRAKYGRDLPISDLMQDISSIHDEMQKANLDAHAQLEAYRTIGFDFKDPVQMTGTVRAVQSEFGQIPLVNVLYKTGGQNLNYRVLGRFPGGEKVLVMSPDSKIKIIQSPFGQTGNTRIKGGATREHFGKIPTVKWQEIGMLSDAWPTKAEIHRVNPGIDNVLDLTDSELQEHFPEVWKRLQEAQDDFGNASGKEMMKIASKEGDGSDPEEVQSRRDAIRDLFNTPNIQLENSAEMLYNTAVVTGYDLLKLHPEKKVWESRMIEKLGDNAKSYLSNTWDAINNKAPMFFSPLERALKTDLPNKASADQIKGIIRKSGVSDDEMKWTGFDEFLKEKAMKEQPVTRQEAIDFFQKNKVQLTERVFAEKPLNTDIPRDMIDKLNESNLDVEATSDGKLIFIDRLDKEEYTVADLDEMSEVRPRDAESARVVNDYWISRNLNLPKFTNLTTPGGTNNREITLSLRTKKDRTFADIANDKSQSAQRRSLATLANYLQSELDEDYGRYLPPSGHRYDIKEADINRIALLRVNDRVGSNGEKILHVDEYQDDLQNEIQKYKAAVARRETQMRSRDKSDPDYQRQVDQDKEKIRERTKELDHLKNLLPFRGKSHELAMKYALGYAINHGYDMITWNTGRQVADRYSLTKHIDYLTVERARGGYKLSASKSNSFGEIVDRPFDEKFIFDHQLDAAVGRELAITIRANSESRQDYDNLNLTTGGEGKLILYDKMIPDFMRKYTKRWGGNVTDASFLASPTAREPYLVMEGPDYYIEGGIQPRPGPFRERDEAKKALVNLQIRREVTNVHGLAITPQMRDSILRSGQSLFGSSEGQPSAVTDALMQVKDQQARRRRNPSLTELESKAYHGSPYHFDKFTLEHIGKGEGAQACGWGLYFTDTKKIAEFYRDKLTDDRQTSVREQAEAIYNALEPLSDGTVFAGQWQAAYNKDEFIRAYEENKLPYDSFSRGVLDKAEKLLFPKGKLYEVNLAPADDEYLLWDKPLDEQSEKVQKVLAEDETFQSFIKEPTSQEVEGWGDIALQKGSGRDLYNALARQFGEEKMVIVGVVPYGKKHFDNDEAASKYLNGLGIRGVKYLDGTSRSKGEGSYNYVIFDDADVVISEIENKNLSKENIEQVIYDHSSEASEMIDTSRVHLGDQMTTRAVSRASRAGRTIHALGKAGDALIDYRDKSNRLYLNNVSEEILRVLRTAATGKRADTVYGVALDAAKLNELITEANSMQELNIDPRAKNVIADLSKAFQSSLDKNQPLVIADASVPSTRTNVKHEEVHRVDFMIRDAFDGIVPDANEIIQIPHMDKLFSKIKSKGYKPDPRIVAMESIARISTGDNEGLGLTEDEELEFLDGYYTLMADTYHEDVLDQYRLITNKAREVRDAVQARFREFSEGYGDATETLQSMEAGREGRSEAGIAESSRGIDTPEFKRWFGNSKVVDENEQPLRLYHGTSEDFDRFDLQAKQTSISYADEEHFSPHPGSGTSIFFSDDPKVANAFAELSGQWKPDYRRIGDGVGQNIIPVYLKIENPYIAEDWKSSDVDKIIDHAKEKGHDGVIFRNSQEIVMNEEGLIDPQEDTATTYAIFYPHQAKSIYNLRPTDKPGILERKVNDSYNYLDRKITDGSLGRSPIEDTYHISVVTGYELFKEYFDTGGYTGPIDKEFRDRWQSDVLRQLGERARPHLDSVWDLISGKAPTFYFPIENLIRTKVPNKASIEQIRGILKGVSDDEMKWSGLNTILSKEKGTITKQELLDYLAINNLKVETITSGITLKPLDWSPSGMSDAFAHRTTDTMGYLYEIKPSKKGSALAYKLTIYTPGGQNVELTRDVESLEAGQGFAEGLRFDKKKPEELVADEIELLDDSGFRVSQNEDNPEEVGFEITDWEEPPEGYEDSTIYTGDELPPHLQEAARSIEEVYRNSAQMTGTRYSQYKLEGGSSYVELKIVVPSTEHKAMLVPGTTREGKEIWQWQQMDEKALSPDYSNREEAITNRPRGYTYIDDAHQIIPDIQPSVHIGTYQSPHYDEPDILATIRGDEREHTDGVNGFVIDETQSDWAHDARVRGIRRSLNPSNWTVSVELDQTKEYGVRTLVALDENGQEIYRRSGFPGSNEDFLEAAVNGVSLEKRNPVPDAPLLKQWPLLTVKQSIRHAVERGLNRVSLMPARVHIDRWGTERAVWSKAYGVISDDKIGSFITHGRNTVSSFATETEAKDAIAKIGAENNVNYKIERVWKFQFKGQEGGIAGGINLEQEGLARGILLKESSIIVRNKEDVIQEIKRHHIQNEEFVIEKVWKEMQKQGDEGVAWPRAEGLLNRYGGTSDYIQERFARHNRPDLLKFAWDRTDGKQSEAFMPIAMRDVSKAWKANTQISQIYTADIETTYAVDRATGEKKPQPGLLYPVYSLDITPQMSNAIIRIGQPLYGTSVDDPSYVLDAKMRMSPQGRKNVIDMGIVVGHSILSKENIFEFKDWSNEMIRQLGESIRPHLESIWSRLQEDTDLSELPVLNKIRDLLSKEKSVTELESKRPRGIFIPDPILISKAIARFGTTSDIKEAGFISSYGEMIGDKDHPYINVEISEMMSSDVEYGEDDDTRNNMLTWEFMHQTGSIAVTHLGKDHFLIQAVRPISKTQSDLLIEKLGGSRRLIITSYNPLNEFIEFNQKLDSPQPEVIKQSIKELNDHILQNPTDLESKKKDQEWSVGYRSEGGKLTGSEGNGIYISKKKSLAREFGDAHPIRYRNPRNPLIVNNEILPILTESDVLEEPISSDDTEWMRLNKHAFQNAKKELGDKWDDEVVAEELTRLLKDKGYDAVDIIQGKDNWLVLLNQNLVRNSITMKHDPKARFPFEFYDHRGNLLYQADNKEQGQQRAEEEWEDKWGSAEMLSRRSKDDKKRRDLAREIQKLFQSIPQAERGKLTNWSKVFKEEDAVKALDAAEDAFANETRGVELESKKSPLNQGMIKKAYKLFGKTNNILAAGYVFPDGSMIEVGETPEGGGSATGYGEGHYEVGIIVDEQQFRKSLQKRDGSEGQLALKFQSLTGAMELAPGAYGKNYKELRVRTAGIPSIEQRQRILQAWKAYDANRLIFDVIENNGKVIFTRSIDAMTAGDVHRLLDEAEANFLSKESDITELERRKDDSLIGRARSQVVSERINDLENQLKESADKLKTKLLNAGNLNDKQKEAVKIRIKFLPSRLGYVDEIGKYLNVTKQRAAQIWSDVLTKANASEEESHYKSVRRELNTTPRVAKKGVDRGSELERKKSDKDKPDLSALFDELVPPSPETNNPPKLKGKSYSERAEIDGWLYNMEREIQTLQERGKPVPTSLLKTYHDLKAERDKSASPSVAGGDGSEPPVPPRSRSYYEEYFERNDPDTLEGFSGKDVTKFDHLRSRLSNLDFIGTYERRGGDLGREASEIMRNTQVAIGQSIIDRNVAIKDMKRDLQPIIEAFRYGGKPGLADMIEDHVLGIASGRGHRSQIGRILKKIQYDTKLRFNIKSSVLNMLQPLQTLWPHVSSREFAQLAFQARQPSIRKSILEKVNKEAGAKVEGETEKRRWLPDLFSKASDTNRIMGYLHGMNEAKRLGLSEDRSERLAADWAKKVEFDNSEWDVIPLFEGDIASVLTQFKGFTVKNIESITNDLKKHKEDTLGGYSARAGKRVFSQLVLGGVKSIPGIKTLAGLLVLGTLAKVLGVFFEDDEAETLAEAVYYGAPSLIGEDISNSMMILDPPFGDTVYEQLLNFLGGPTISTTASIIEKGGKQDYMGAVKSITPYYRMGESAIDLIKGGATTLPAPSGHDIELNRFETLMRVLGFTPVKQSRFYEGRGVLNLQSNIAASLGVVKTKNDIPSQLEWKLIDKARKQYLDDPPMSPDSIEHVETEKQIINTLRSGRLADDSITDKAREGARKQLSDAIERDILAPDDESRIAKKAMMSYLQYNVSNMPLENALDIFLDSSATKEERASIAAILADKYMRWQNERMEEAKTHKESVPRKVYERILNKLEQAKKLGIVEMAQEKAKAAIVK